MKSMRNGDLDQIQSHYSCCITLINFPTWIQGEKRDLLQNS